MKRSMDVAALVTGLIVLGFGVMSFYVLSGGTVLGEPAMGFAIILMLAGGIGLIVSQRTPRR